jgi:hypothetical protein
MCNEANLRFFSECALMLQENGSDYETATSLMRDLKSAASSPVQHCVFLFLRKPAATAAQIPRA